jgi:hypothetical protein
MIELALPKLVLSALSSSFLTVKLVKGSWARNPQYLGLSMAGSTMAMLIASVVAPGSTDDFVIRIIVAFAGAFASMTAFDKAIGHV